ncbi:MAG: GlsB/YeaQ/YmgE family stress response membrane protein, partial [Microcystis sp.]
GGFIATMFLGIIGAFIGGSLLTFIQTGSLQLASASLSIPGVATAVLGAIIAIAVWNFLNRG